MLLINIIIFSPTIYLVPLRCKLIINYLYNIDYTIMKEVKKQSIFPVITSDETKTTHLVFLTLKQIEKHLSKRFSTMLADQRTSLVPKEQKINNISVERIKIDGTYHIAILLSFEKFTKHFSGGLFNVIIMNNKRPVDHECPDETTIESVVETPKLPVNTDVKVEEKDGLSGTTIRKKLKSKNVFTVFKHITSDQYTCNDYDYLVVIGKKPTTNLLRSLSKRHYVLHTAA